MFLQVQITELNTRKFESFIDEGGISLVKLLEENKVYKYSRLCFHLRLFAGMFFFFFTISLDLSENNSWI